MTTMPVAQRMTAREFLRLPERPNGKRLELVEGEVVVSDPTMLHGEVVGDLQFALEVWARAEPRRGAVRVPADVGIDERNVYVPDLLWYGDGHVPDRFDQPPYPLPDLAVEVRSPSTWRYDIGAKKAGYERSGLPELWLVDTAAEVVLAFRRSAPGASVFDVALELERGARLESALLPGFALPVGELFPAQ